MDVTEAIKGRRTISTFSNEAVSSETLKNAVEAAIHAPNHHLTWPWFFIHTQGDKRDKLADFYVKLKTQKASEALSETATAALREKFLEPPVLLIVGIKKPAPTVRVFPNQEKEDYASLACALQNMALYLWSQDVGMKWSTGKLIHSNETYSLLGISPETHEIAGIIYIGYPRGIPAKVQRPPVEQFFWSV